MCACSHVAWTGLFAGVPAQRIASQHLLTVSWAGQDLTISSTYTVLSKSILFCCVDHCSSYNRWKTEDFFNPFSPHNSSWCSHVFSETLSSQRCHELLLVLVAGVNHFLSFGLTQTLDDLGAREDRLLQRTLPSTTALLSPSNLHVFLRQWAQCWCSCIKCSSISCAMSQVSFQRHYFVLLTRNWQ